MAVSLALFAPSFGNRSFRTSDPVPARLATLIGLGGAELARPSGWSRAFICSHVQFIGTVIAMVSGFNAMAAVGDRGYRTRNRPLAGIISFSALMILFIFDFHHAVVRALVDTYEVMPLEALFDPQVALVNLVDTISDSFLVMVRLGSPFIAYAILVNLAIGLVNKLTPQIPIYFVALPFVIAGALLNDVFRHFPHAEPDGGRLHPINDRTLTHDTITQGPAQEGPDPPGAAETPARRRVMPCSCPAPLPAEREAEEIMQRHRRRRFRFPMSFPEIYHRRIARANQLRGAEHQANARVEAQRLAQANARTDIVERNYREARQMDDRPAQRKGTARRH